MSTIEELWFGNINPNENIVITDEEKKVSSGECFIDRMSDIWNRI